MTRLRVDLPALAELTQRMRRFGAHLAVVHADADRRITDLHASWAGEAAELQRVAHRQWSAAAGDLQQALDRLHSIGVTAHHNYSAAVRANQRMWRQ